MSSFYRCILLAPLLALSSCGAFEGVNLHVANQSGRALSATAKITGQSIAVGVIGSGSSARVRLRPSSESRIELAIKEEGKPPRRYVIDTYFEPGYSGCIAATINPGGEVVVLQNLEAGPSWLNCPQDAHDPASVNVS